MWDSPAPLQDSLADYEMDQRIVSTNRTRIMDGLATIPTISIVTDPRRIWSPTEGFYVRKTYDGDNFGTPIVQPCSVEMIFGPLGCSQARRMYLQKSS